MPAPSRSSRTSPSPRAVHDDIDALLDKKRKGAAMSKAKAVRISLAVEDTTVGQVIEKLQIQTGMSLMIDPRLSADASKQPIAGMKLEDTPLGTALTMVASAAGEHALWEGRGNVLLLTRTAFTKVK